MPIFPAIYSTAILDGSVLLGLVYGLTRDHAYLRAVNLTLLNGYPASMVRVVEWTG